MRIFKIAMVTLLASAGTVAAAQQTSMTVAQFQQTRVSLNCRNWVAREIEVCDERAVYDNEAYKQCHYNRTYTTSPAIFPTTYSMSIAVNGQCYHEKILGAPGHSPHAG